jgi:PAS domain S-box-containing protein
MSVLDTSNVSMIITDPTLPDHPIVYVNSAFERVTLYPRDAALGRNCRFLQGPETDPEHVAHIRRAIDRNEDATVDILNYRADGSTFVNRLVLTPIRAEDGRPRLFLGLQKPLGVAEQRQSWSAAMAMLREMQHRVKNHLAMVAGMIRMQSRQTSDPAGFEAVAARVQSLHALYAELSDPSDGGLRGADVALGPFLGRLADSVLRIDGRPGLTVAVQAPEISLDGRVGAKLGLVVTEVVTNAVKHAFVGSETGHVDIVIESVQHDMLRLIIADDGVGMPPDTNWPATRSVGGRVMGALLHDLGATHRLERPGRGTRLVLEFPRTLSSAG